GEELDSAACACRVTNEQRPKREGGRGRWSTARGRMARSVHWHCRLNAPMHAHVAEGHFQLPAADKPGDETLQRGVRTGAEQRGGAQRAAGTAEEQPTDRPRRKAGRVPVRRRGAPRTGALGLPLPVATSRGVRTASGS